jgi:hypothetical protein
MSQGMWIAIENGVRHYTVHPKKHDPDSPPPPEPSSLFGPTFNTPRIAFRAQSQKGWENFIKGLSNNG